MFLIHKFGNIATKADKNAMKITIIITNNEQTSKYNWVLKKIIDAKPDNTDCILWA